MMPDISWGIKILELINKPHIYWGGRYYFEFNVIFTR